MNMTNFPTNSELESVCKKETSTIKWSDIPNDWYRIESQKNVKTTQFGERTILELSNRNGELFSVWTPGLVTQRLEEMPDANYIQVKGLVKSKKNPTRTLL
jgi:hypothetical protein